MIEQKKIDALIKEITKKFPDYKGIKPELTKKAILPQTRVYQKLSLRMPKAIKHVMSMKFKKMVRTADAVTMERILVVTIDDDGKIIKISQSR
jgi:hypothetical protein